MLKNFPISQEIVTLKKNLKEREKEKGKLFNKRKEIEEKLFLLEKEKLREKKGSFLIKIEKLKKGIKEIEKKEKEIKLVKEKIEEREKEEKDLLKKREIEKERWKTEAKERGLERKKWRFEDELEKEKKGLREIERGLEKELELREKLEKVEKELLEIEKEIKFYKEKIKEKKEIEKEFNKAWEDYLSGNISLALERLKKIQEKLAQKVEKKEKFGEKAPEEKKKKEFFEPLEYYQKGEITPALSSLDKLLEKIKKETPLTKKEERPEERKISPPLIIFEKKEKPEKALEEFKEKMEKEREELIEKERGKLKKLREELEERQKEILRSMIEGRKIGLEEERITKLQEELLERELALEREYRKRLRAQREELLKQKEELQKAEKSLFLEGLTEEERKKREEIIRTLREKIEEERRKIESNELAAEEEKEASRIRKLAILEDIFEQALSFYKEKEFEKAKRVFTIIKGQLEQGEKLGIFVNLNKIPIYTKSVYLLKKAAEEIERERKEKEIIAKTRKEKVAPKIKPRQKVSLAFYFSPRRLLRFFQDIFSPLPIIGLDISDYSLELLLLNKKGKVLAFARELLKEGILIEGKIKKLKSFSQALSSLLKKGGFPSYQPEKGPLIKAVVSLPNSAIYVAIFRFESSEKLFEQVKEELERTFLLSLEEIYWDYRIVDLDEFGRVKIVSVAAEKEVVDLLVYALRANGIEPIAFDIGIFSIKRALLPQLPLKERVGILDLGAYITTFNIFDLRGKLEFSTTIPYGGKNFQKSIVNALKLSPEEAEKIISDQGFQKSPTKDILEKEIEKIFIEIKEAIKYYQETVFRESIKKIILTGGTSSLPGIIEVFKKNFPFLEIELFNPFEKMKIKKPLSLKESLFYTCALGLALRAISKNPAKEGINLLPEETKRKEKRKIFFAFLKRFKK